MKSLKYVAVASALMFALGPVAYAQGVANPRAEVKQEIKDERKEIKAEIKTSAQTNRKELEVKRDQLKKQVTDRRMELIKKFAVQMTRVHQAAIKRLTKLGDRIDSRIAKSATTTPSLVDAKAKMVIARADIATAQTYLDSVAAQVNTITSNASTTPQVAFQSVKDLFAESRKNLKTAQQALVDAISSIKLGLGMNATTTTP